MVPQVYFYETFEEELAQLREKLPPTIKFDSTPGTVQESGDLHPPAKIISIRTQSVVPPHWAGHLEAVLSRSTGYDHLSALRQGTNRPILGYLPLYCNRAVAEHAMMLWTALARHLPRQVENFRTFQRDGLTGMENAGKVLLVVGVGHIGYQIVRIGRGLEMRVLGVDIIRRHADVEYTDIDSGLRRADIIVCAMNLTPENHGYFNETRLRQTRQGVIFVNIARGEQSPSTELLRLMETGHLGGIGLDVYDAESQLAVALRQGTQCDNREVQATLALSRLPNVILTPHNAFNTREAVERKVQQSVEQLRRFFGTGRFIWEVPQ